MDSELLGKIKIDNGMGTAAITYDGANIRVRIESTSGIFDGPLALAEAVCRKLASIDSEAKTIAAAKLLNNYNENWSEYDEMQSDGSLKTTINPKLSEAEFCAKLVLTEVTAAEDSVVRLTYADSDMFAGHSIIVNSFTGTELENAHVDLFG